MKNRKSFRSVLLIVQLSLVIAVSGTVLWLQRQGRDGSQTGSQLPKKEEKEEKQPNDWFFRQRAYPLGEIPLDQRMASISEARALKGTDKAKGVWIQAGPTNIPGRITDLAVHPSDFSTIYAGAAAGGVFKSTDSGLTWTAIFDDQGSPSIGALAIHPSDPNILYVGTGEANSSGDSYPGTGVYKTTDAGSTWTHLGLDQSRHIGRIVIDPVEPQKVYVAALGTLFGTNPDRGVYRSTDGGTSWTQVLFVSDSTGAVDIAINPSDPNVLYAAMWERIRSPERRRAGGFESGIHKTTDGGLTWNLLTNGLPPSAPDVGRIGLAVAVSSPSTVYAIYADHPGYFMGVYKSTDSGGYWFRVNDSALTWLYSSFGWYFGNIRVDPTDPDKVFALGVPLYLSTDGGDSWSEVGATVHVDQHAMVIPEPDPSRIYLGNDGGVYLSGNGGWSWTHSLNQPSTQFYAINIDRSNPERLYGGTQDNGTLRTLTGAIDDWQRIFGGDGFYCSIDYNDPNILYVEYQWGNLYKSTNNGASWNEAMSGISVTDRTNWSTPVVMDPNHSNILYYGSNRLYRSTDGANWWTAISPDLTDGPGSGNLTYGTITTIAASTSDSQVVYVGTDDANVWVTQNLGATWTDISAGLPNRWVTRVAVDLSNPAVAYVTHSGYRSDSYLPHIHRTTDYGQTWQDVSGNLPEAPITAAVVDPHLDSTLYVGTDVGVYVTSDLGQLWSPLGTGLPIPVIHDLVLHEASRSLVAGTHGRSMFRYELDRHDGGVISLDAPGDTVFSDSTYAVMATVHNFGNVTETFSVVATIDGYADTAQVVALAPSADTQLTFSPWTVPSADSTTYIMTVCTSVPGDADSTNDCAQKSIFAYNPVGVQELPGAQLPVAGFQLWQNRPNPFGQFTIINYQLPKPVRATLSIYDLSGRVVRSLVDEEQEPGYYSVAWDLRGVSGEHLPSGIYFCRLRAGDFVKMRKMTLVR